ncbi:MAG: hypothetical protein AB7N76_12170 [Planctomycetota bacterium]
MNVLARALRRPALLLVLLAPLSVGCASAERADEQRAPADSGGSLEGLPDRGARYGDEPKQAPTTADPYSKRAGGEAPPDAPPPPAEVRFRDPDPWPALAARRPALRRPARLAMVWVRRGVLAPEVESLLRLESRLGKDPDLAQLVMLGVPDRAEVTLTDLARQAGAEGRELLLVELCPGRGGAPREGLLLAAPRGELLATVAIGVDQRDGPRPRWESQPDLVGRVARAYRALREEGRERAREEAE